jgi:hypothetical protein
MSATVLLKALGLNTQPNQLDPASVPPGSLTIADNVIIKRDNVIESRRGYHLYGDAVGSSSDRADQLAVYRNRILRHWGSTLEFDTGSVNTITGTETFDAFAGTYNNVTTGYRPRFIESKGNMYFNTSEGVQKISAKNASQFSTADSYITQSGGINALDFTTQLDVTTGSNSGFLAQDASVAYRILWNTNDANDNLVYGAPSQRQIVTNSLQSLLLRDYQRFLAALDNVANNTAFPSLLTYNQFVATYGLPSNATAIELQANLVNIATTIDQNIVYASENAPTTSIPLQLSGANLNGTVVTVAFTDASGNPANYLSSGQVVELQGFAPTTGTISGTSAAPMGQTIATVYPSVTLTGTTTTGTAAAQTVTTVADISDNLGGKYWQLWSADNTTQYTIWYNDAANSIGSQPTVPGTTIYVEVVYNENDTAAAIAQETVTTLSGYSDFTIAYTPTTSTFVVTNTAVGVTNDALPGNTTFSITSTAGTDGNIISGLSTTDGLVLGGLVTGSGIPANTYITAIGSNGPGTITVRNNSTISHSTSLVFGSAFTFIPTTTTPAVTGPITLTNATINSYTFESITQPAVPGDVATDAELVALQTYLTQLITAIQQEPSSVISSESQTAFFNGFTVTTSANVTLTITIPQNVTTNYFFQIYRSQQALATGPSSINDIAPNDELQEVYEAYPTAAEIAAGVVTVTDIATDSFLGAYLYTDATNGTGILSANQVPPVCQDMTYFENVMFYANTRIQHQLQLNLLGVANMITDYNNGIIPTIVITDGVQTNTYTFVIGLSESTSITTKAASTLAATGTADYFNIYSANNTTQYYVWYKLGTSTDPLVNGATAIEVPINAGDSAATVAQKTANALNVYNYDFNITYVPATNVITVETTGQGTTSASTDSTTGFTITQVQAGQGENAAAKEVLLSTNPSPATAVDLTARSLVHVINLNTDSSVYAYYLSDPTSVPGQFNLQKKTFSTLPFYIIANDSNTGTSFNPNLTPDENISAITIGAESTTITTNLPHGLLNQDQVVIDATGTTPNINGLYTITYISPTSFSIPVVITSIGTPMGGFYGSVRAASTAPVSDNEVLPNRIYYSTYLEPEGVPIVNTIDVGANDKAILRIIPLRTSLFVFKEDGLFRISGSSAPFSLEIFDASVVIVAPDSVDISNNLVFCWTTKGIHTVSEGGVNIISRPIDNLILPLATPQYTNFKTATWGIGYESDNSYTVYTVQALDDTVATIGFRYSTLTNSWTNYLKSNTCGVINYVDDLQYMGAGDVNYIEQERKTFSRYDYADREIDVNLTPNNYLGQEINLTSISGVDIGDVVVQNQYITLYSFNTFLEKLDLDPHLSDNYVATQTIAAGINLRTALDSLITAIANDPVRLSQPFFTPASTYLALTSDNNAGAITAIAATNPATITSADHGLENGRMVIITGTNSTPSIDGEYAVTVIDANTFSVPVAVTGVGTTGQFIVDNQNYLDILASFNNLVITLNADTAISFHNYSQITQPTVQETIITDVTLINTLTTQITTALLLDFFEGPLIIYKSIPTLIEYAPQTLGDPLGLKHMREATMIFENKAFTNAVLSFASDLFPQLNPITVFGDGNGIFGYSGNNWQQRNFGFGSNFFGGASNSVPFRTYIPRNNQRCRYITVQFSHQIAREQWAIFGITLTGEISQSSRAYR